MWAKQVLRGLGRSETLSSPFSYSSLSDQNASENSEFAVHVRHLLVFFDHFSLTTAYVSRALRQKKNR